MAAPAAAPVVRFQKDSFGRLVRPKDPAAQQALADRIAAINVDVLAIQEVENIDALRRFNRDLLGGRYPFEVLIEGNDPRLIDVAVLSRLPVANVTSHRFEVHPDAAELVFGRDLVELDVMTNSGAGRRRLVKLFVTHLKSKFVPHDAEDPDAVQVANTERRTRQAETIARVVDHRTRSNERFVVLGDMNDAPDSAALAPMIADLDLVDALADVVESRPPPTASEDNSPPLSVGPRWTYRLSVPNGPDQFDLIDQIWVSQALADRVEHAEIDRRLAWTAAARSVGSDHDPVWIRLDV